MWINNSISLPLRKGEYRTLVEEDGLGNLCEANNELFNGVDWCVYNSHYQFIHFWWAEKEDYNVIADCLEEQKEKYIKEMAEKCKNLITEPTYKALINYQVEITD